jgi:hypothetical protein
MFQRLGGKDCAMSTPEMNAGANDLSLSDKAISTHSEVKETIVAHAVVAEKSAIAKVLTISPQIPKEIRIIIEQTSISVVFILGDMLVVWLVGLAFADAVKDIPFVGYLYNGVKIASVLVITIRYLFNCIVDMNRSRKDFLSELKSAEKTEKPRGDMDQ